MKTKLLILNFSFLILTACGASKPIATVHTERIEERLKPVAVGADTIVLEMQNAKCKMHNDSTPKTSKASKNDCALSIMHCALTKSTRGVSVKTTHTDTTQTLRITLQPDTIFVPYVHHIRFDTIIAPDPTTKAKLTTARWQIVALILILIAITIILFIRQNDKKT